MLLGDNIWQMKKVSPVLKSVKRALELTSASPLLPSPSPLGILLNLVSNEKGNGLLPTLHCEPQVTIFDVTW